MPTSGPVPRVLGYDVILQGLENSYCGSRQITTYLHGFTTYISLDNVYAICLFTIANHDNIV